MATSDILGLFVSPEQYQAQQLAQQQANEQQRAFNFAQLSPRDQAVYGTFLGAQQLGRGFSGLLGVQDPQLQRIRQREQIMQSINPADANSLMAGIQRASQTGDSELALSLTDFMREQESKIQLGRQRQAAAEKERVQSQSGGIQEAARIGAIERDQAKMRAENVNAAESDEYKALEAEKLRLQRAARAAGTTDDEKKATAYANSVSADPESKEWKDAFNSALNRLIFGKDSDKVDDVARLEKYLTDLSTIRTQYGTDTKGFENDTKAKALQILIDKVSGVKGSNKQFEKLALNDEIVRLKELQAGLKKDSPEYKVYQEQIDFLKGDTGKNKVSTFAQLLLDRNIEPGSTEWNTRMDAYINKESTRSEPADQITSIGETVAGNKEGLPAGLKVYSNKTSKTQYVLRDGKEVPYYGSVEPPGKTTVEVKNIMPGQGKDGPKGISAFRNEVIQSIKPFRDTVTGADSALASIKDSMKNKNYISFNAARTQLAKALGDNTLSRNDIEQAGADPSILGGLYDKASTLFTGTPSPDTQKKIESTIKIIRKLAVEKANAELGVQRQLGIRAGYTEQDINMAFNFPEITGGDGAAKPGNKSNTNARDASTLPRGK